MKFLVVIITMWMLNACQPLFPILPEESITAVGTASISAQQGNTPQDKQVQAMRASKLEAYKELAEQVYGVRLSSVSNVNGQTLYEDQAKGVVDGVIRAAKVAASYPIGDSYVTELILNLREMQLMSQFGEVTTVPVDNKIEF